MAETCILNFKDSPSDMKKHIKRFLKGEQVWVEDNVGREYRVVMRKNSLVLSDP